MTQRRKSSSRRKSSRFTTRDWMNGTREKISWLKEGCWIFESRTCWIEPELKMKGKSTTCSSHLPGFRVRKSTRNWSKTLSKSETYASESRN
jgi:hypothetical protein